MALDVIKYIEQNGPGQLNLKHDSVCFWRLIVLIHYIFNHQYECDHAINNNMAHVVEANNVALSNTMKKICENSKPLKLLTYLIGWELHFASSIWIIISCDPTIPWIRTLYIYVAIE